MTNEQSENHKITFSTGTGEYKFSVEGPMRKGSIGGVYKVRDEKGNVYALKLLSDHSKKELFEENSKALVADGPLPYFINTTMGTATENKQTIPALLMEYGGDDLATVLDHFEKHPDLVDSRIKEAFAYKTMLTVLYALDDLHKHGKAHYDLLPSNILSGVDVNQKDLPNSLLYGEVKLCDRIALNEQLKNQLTSVINASIASKASYIEYLTFHVQDQDPKERDIGHATVLSKALIGSYVSSPNNPDYIRNLKPIDFADLILGFFKLDKNTGKRSFPTVKEMIEKINSLIDNTQYFYRTEALSKDRSTKYPLVLRPLDMFVSEYKDKTLDTINEFDDLLKTGKYSLEEILKKGPKLKDDEKE